MTGGVTRRGITSPLRFCLLRPEIDGPSSPRCGAKDTAVPAIGGTARTRTGCGAWVATPSPKSVHHGTYHFHPPDFRQARRAPYRRPAPQPRGEGLNTPEGPRLLGRVEAALDGHTRRYLSGILEPRPRWQALHRRCRPRCLHRWRACHQSRGGSKRVAQTVSGRFTPRRFVPNLHRERARTGDPPSPVYPDARRGSTVPSSGTVEQAGSLAARRGSPRGRHVFGGHERRCR